MALPYQDISCPPGTVEASVYAGLCVGIRDYIEKNGISGVLLGLSGGVDSALTMAIAVDALGAERVEAVMMPSQFTADISLSDARTMARTLGVRYSELPIDGIFAEFKDDLAHEFARIATARWHGPHGGEPAGPHTRHATDGVIE